MEAAQERKNTVQERMDAAQDCMDPDLERLSQVSSAGTVVLDMTFTGPHTSPNFYVLCATPY